MKLLLSIFPESKGSCALSALWSLKWSLKYFHVHSGLIVQDVEYECSTQAIAG